jgi:para-nitrobenzyl esterase
VIYKGIPYAAPPTGNLRWRPPQPALDWGGVREATTFGMACPQSSSPLARGRRQWSEDCLTINLWVPAASPAGPLPVLVVIHGGGFFVNAGDGAILDGTNLAQRGIIVVTFNYRLGVFGFFAHPMLSKESATHVSGNYGLMDQIAALHWVHDNIRAFGGDPRNVTITGGSAGGSSVLYLIVSPLAKGLFARGIAESAASVYGPLGSRTERRYGIEAREAQGLQLGADIAALRAMPATELHERAALETNVSFADGPNYWPMVDGAVLPDEPWALFDSGRFARVPLLIGTAADEGTIFALGNPIRTRDAWANHLARRHPGAESEVQAAYVPADTDLFPVAVRWVNDWTFHGTARAVARAVAARGVPVYLFNFSRALPYHPPIEAARGRNLGASHSIETMYTFGNFVPPFATVVNDTDRALSTTMMNAWVQFIRTGDPNVAGLPQWPRYAKSSDQHMDFGDEIRVVSGLHAASLDAFDAAFAKMRAPYRTRTKQ